MISIPGIGPVMAAGWLIATLAGAAGGALADGAPGGIVSALIKSAVPEEDANVHTESVRRGGALVIARVEGEEVAITNQILDLAPRVDIGNRRAFYAEQGWRRFDDTLDPYAPSNTDPIHYAPPPRV
ncbi:hypothetical protein G6K98_32395 [Agrobacterium rhizogenes]|nr:hypothetical protein [Rhizobium rhizogenes]NTH62215.1 hypothetical protein [Rhizobium rhizogenes]NTH93841.1 hypothetical protein [Rhizobium rhizogenes]